MAVSMLNQLLNRERQPEHHTRHFARHNQVTGSLIRRLDKYAELEAHTGCVNCLEWNDSGTILASGSDDLHVILWDAFRRQRLHTIQTSHMGNIFSVKFMPNSNDNLIVSGAADWRVIIHDVKRVDAPTTLTCHTARVKRLATSASEPNLFWSSSEDGTVMEHDLRSPKQESVLVNLTKHCGGSSEAKCLAISPTRPYLLAVGANDPYARVYDRRHMSFVREKIGAPNTESSSRASHFSRGDRSQINRPADYLLPDSAVQYYVPGHISLKHCEQRYKNRNLASTYVTFSPAGNELLVNLGGEQIYLYDVVRSKKAEQLFLPPKNCTVSEAKSKRQTSVREAGALGHSSQSNGLQPNGTSSPPVNGKRSSKRPKHDSVRLPQRAERYKQQANAEFERQKYTNSIQLYSCALSLAPNASVLYGNRAAAYMKRNWDGDVYLALRDCHAAIDVDPAHVKAHFRLSRCLHELGQYDKALETLKLFRAKFSDYAKSHACEALERDIRAALYSNEERSRRSPEQPRRSAISAEETVWRERANDFEQRFCGHCNTTTDIKEANFFGSEGRFVLAGSDDGLFVIWDRTTSNIIQMLRGDESIVNCLQGHNSSCFLATSGIDPLIRLWAPRPEDGTENEQVIDDSISVCAQNQTRMKADPLEGMLFNMGYHIPASGSDNEGSEGETPHVQCRTS